MVGRVKLHRPAHEATAGSYRDLDETLYAGTSADMLADARTGKDGRHPSGGLLQQSTLGRLSGYEQVNEPIDCTAMQR